VELCERKFKTYFINSEKEMVSRQEIRHFNHHDKTNVRTKDYLPDKDKVKIILTSGASCPDTLVDNVMLRIIGYFQQVRGIEQVLEEAGIK
jgi:4-hydroxy-3-methylbut-2-enyl diphosphate reductase